MPTIQPMFATPLAFDTIRAGPLNAALRALFLRRESEGFANPRRTPNATRACSSRFDLFQWPEPEIAELREFCMPRVWQLVQTLNGHAPAAMRQWRMAVESWFHITRRNGWFGVHNHPNASWSGVYCVDAGRPDADVADSGKLTFPASVRHGRDAHRPGQRSAVPAVQRAACRLRARTGPAGAVPFAPAAPRHPFAGRASGSRSRSTARSRPLESVDPPQPTRTRPGSIARPMPDADATPAPAMPDTPRKAPIGSLRAVALRAAAQGPVRRLAAGAGRVLDRFAEPAGRVPHHDRPRLQPRQRRRHRPRVRAAVRGGAGAGHRHRHPLLLRVAAGRTRGRRPAPAAVRAPDRPRRRLPRPQPQRRTGVAPDRRRR